MKEGFHNCGLCFLWGRFGFFPLIFLLIIMVWNVQSAASANFRRVFKVLVNKHKPIVVSLLEPRVSGVSADDFIRKSGFGWHLVIV